MVSDEQSLAAQAAVYMAEVVGCKVRIAFHLTSVLQHCVLEVCIRILHFYSLFLCKVVLLHEMQMGQKLLWAVRVQALNRTAYFTGTGHVQDHFNRQTIDIKCVSTVQVRACCFT